MRGLKLFVLGVATLVVLFAAGNTSQLGLGQGACTMLLNASQSIQATINNAPSNAVICLGAGTWREDLTITKDGITLLGQGPSQSFVIGAFIVQVAGPFTVEGLSLGRAPTSPLLGSRSSCTTSLNPGQSIQQAVDAAAPSAVLCLGAGIYAEQVLIQGKSLVLRGAGRDQTFIDGSTIAKPHAAGIEVADSTQVTLDGLTVRNFTVAGQVSYFHGLYVHDQAQVTVQNSQFTGNSDNGIWVTGAARASLLNDVISGNGGYGVAVSGPANLLACQGNTVSNNARGNFLNKSGSDDAVASECR